MGAISERQSSPRRRCRAQRSVHLFRRPDAAIRLHSGNALGQRLDALLCPPLSGVELGKQQVSLGEERIEGQAVAVGGFGGGEVATRQVDTAHFVPQRRGVGTQAHGDGKLCQAPVQHVPAYPGIVTERSPGTVQPRQVGGGIGVQGIGLLGAAQDGFGAAQQVERPHLAHCLRRQCHHLFERRIGA